ncbi:MAG: 2-amino-4-hydroxy-6-hydroxymethyldihydropteridine diphosphokinase [Muribaculaceae bacterium]|nr:2-amino-4-hydroxy-6-hydroxymethyldihydropteridine diphosphokinase [Muribaculaceae bacterium]
MEPGAEKKPLTICLGSNVSDAAERVASALRWLKSVIDIQKSTAPYMTPPEGSDISGRPYYNALAKGLTDRSIEHLTAMLKRYESECGRTPGHKLSGKVIIDLDVVEYDNRVIDSVNYRSGYYRSGLHILNAVTSEN